MYIRTIIVSLIMISFFSCKRKLQEQGIEWDYKLSATNSSSEAIEYMNNTVYKDFQNKLVDPTTAEVAKRWQGPLQATQLISKSGIRFIDSIVHLITSNINEQNKYECKNSAVSKLFYYNNLSDRLYDSLQYWQDTLVNINKESGIVFSDEKLLPASANDSVNVDKSVLAVFFKDKCVNEAVYNLNVFKNKLLLLENKLITFYNFKIAIIRDYYDVFSPIIGQSARVVEPGGKIDITAGIGAFSRAANPVITFGNDAKEPVVNGVAIKTIIAPSKPGIYKLPVSIQYFEPDGRILTKKFTIEYKVVKAIEP